MSKSTQLPIPFPNSDGSISISLTQGKVAIIDAADYTLASQYKWFAAFNKASGDWRAGRNKFRIDGTKYTLYMHVLIMNPEPGYEVDHINGDTLDNRRCNLRLATSQQNRYNSKKSQHKNATSQYKGVQLFKGKWRARIGHNGVRLYLGKFPSEIEAAKAYDEKALELFGAFARLNFPD